MRTQTLFISFAQLAKAAGAVALVRIAMVCNDLAIANSSMGRYKEARSRALSHVQRGGQLYFARVSCGHLYEGMKAIKEIRDQPELSAFVRRCTAKAQAGFAELCECLPKGKEHKSFENYIGWIRNRVAFHYDANDLRWALENRRRRSAADTSSMTGGGDIHSTRFEFADELLDTIVCRKFWNIPANADVRAEADRIADWCGQKCLRFLEFGEDFVPRFLRMHSILR